MGVVYRDTAPFAAFNDVPPSMAIVYVLSARTLIRYGAQYFILRVSERPAYTEATPLGNTHQLPVQPSPDRART